MRNYLTRLSFLALLLISAKGQALSLGVFGGLRSLSNQAPSGVKLYVPQSGAKIGLPLSSFSLEIQYAMTQAAFGNISLMDHAGTIGARVPSSQRDFQWSFIGGASYFYTTYSGGLSSSGYSQIALMMGIGISYNLGFLQFFTDFSTHFWTHDSATMLNGGLAMVF